MKKTILLLFLFSAISGITQTDSLYCTPRIENGLPAKLFSFGLDYQTEGYLRPKYNSDGQENTDPMTKNSIDINGAGGLRTMVNVPIINKPGLLLQAGFQYQRYQVASYEADFIAEVTTVNYLNNKIVESPWTSSGFTLSAFKPWNKKWFSVFQGSADFNGNYTGFNYPSLPHVKYSAALLVGQKPKKNMMWALGASRSYRAGELVYFPIALLSWTPTPHIGIELLLPAKASVRYIFNKKSYLMLAYELEGQSYYFDRNPQHYELYADKEFEFRKSEYRIRLQYDFPIYKFVWGSVNVGYRINNKYNIDEIIDSEEVKRVWGKDQPFFQENKLTNSTTMGVAINVMVL